MSFIDPRYPERKQEQFVEVDAQPLCMAVPHIEYEINNTPLPEAMEIIPTTDRRQLAELIMAYKNFRRCRYRKLSETEQAIRYFLERQNG